MASILPNQVDAEQIPDQPVVDNAAIRATDTSAALAQLAQLYREGKIRSDQLTDMFSPAKLQQSNEEIQTSRARTSLLPAQTAVAANKLGVENSLIQPRAQAELGDINSKIALQPGALDIAQKQQKAGQATAGFQSGEAITDPTESDKQVRENFAAIHFGNILRNPDGTPDYEAMGASNERFAQFRMQQIVTPAQKEIIDQMKDRSPEDQAKMYSNGGLKPVEDLRKVLAESKPRLNATETQSNTSAIISADAGLASIERARNILSKDPGAVGSEYNQGSAIGRTAAQVGALKIPFISGIANKVVGSDTTKRFDNQKQLNTTLSAGILDSIRSLRGTGAIRNTEIDAIEKGQPQPDSSVEQWNTWLKQSEDLLKRAQRAQKLGLGPQTQAAIAPQAPVIQDEPPAPAIAAPGEVNAAGAVPVTITTQEQYQALQPGTHFVDGKGKPGIRL